MSVSASVQAHLSRKGVIYDLLNHPHSRCSLESARLARIPPDQVAKGGFMELMGGQEHMTLGPPAETLGAEKA